MGHNRYLSLPSKVPHYPASLTALHCTMPSPTVLGRPPGRHYFTRGASFPIRRGLLSTLAAADGLQTAVKSHQELLAIPLAARANQVVGISSSSSTTQSSEGRAQLDMQYYLTAGLEGVKRQRYRNIRSFSKAIDSRYKEFHDGNWKAGQYMVFLSVTQKHLADIHRLRQRRHKGLGWMYLKSEEVLIVKVIPSAVTEIAQRGFGMELDMKTMKMGPSSRLCDVGCATFEGLIGQKEADSTFKPMCRIREEDWPTIVFECGLSESLERLRVDSRWWLENSTDVKIALLFSISRADKGIHLEQWEMLTAPDLHATGAHHNPLTTRLTKTNEIDIVAGVASGAPLTLDFEKVFLRPRVLGEGDIVFSAQELEEWAAHIWAGAK